MGKILFILSVGVLIAGSSFWLEKEDVTSPPENFENDTLIIPSEESVAVVESVSKPMPPEPIKPKSVFSTMYPVPFVPQAPTGDWSQSAFQDGCEEASTLMVSLARTGKTMTIEAMRLELLRMAEFQIAKIGHGVDTDLVTTKTILLEEYFGITDAELLVYDFTLEELKEAVMKGLVIVPTNGRALGNPNYTPPGPLQHMLVITGYDLEKKEFITNDPGTRKGEGYRYSERVLYEAIREYPTGKHLPIKTERKAMIVVPFAPQP